MPRLAYLRLGRRCRQYRRPLCSLYHLANSYMVHLDLEASPVERMELVVAVRDGPIYARILNNCLAQKKPSCGICMENKPLSDIIFIKGCSHSYCLRCVDGYVAANVEENVAVFACPDAGREDGTFQPKLFKPMLSHEVFDYWCDVLCVFAIQKKLYYPFKDFSAPLADESGEEVIREAECSHCTRLFCAQCKVSWHPEIAGEDFQKFLKNEKKREDVMLMGLGLYRS